MNLRTEYTSASTRRIHHSQRAQPEHLQGGGERFFFDNLLVRIHFIIVMIRRTGLAPLGFEGGVKRHGEHLIIETYSRGVTDMRVALICPESMKEYFFQDLSPVENPGWPNEPPEARKNLVFKASSIIKVSLFMLFVTTPRYIHFDCNPMQGGWSIVERIIASSATDTSGEPPDATASGSVSLSLTLYLFIS